MVVTVLSGVFISVIADNFASNCLLNKAVYSVVTGCSWFEVLKGWRCFTTGVDVREGLVLLVYCIEAEIVGA